MCPGHLAVQAESWKGVEAAITIADRVIRLGLGVFNDSDKHHNQLSLSIHIHVMWHFTEGEVWAAHSIKHYTLNSISIMHQALWL